jgi:hypothetical protein
VPSKVIAFNEATNEIGGHWRELRAVFSQTDQCLTIEDPLESVIDEIQGLGELSSKSMYLLRRLPVSFDENGVPVQEPARQMLLRSLAAFQARRRGEQDAIDGQIARVVNLRQELMQASEAEQWQLRIAAAFGISSTTIAAIDEGLSSGTWPRNTSGWVSWLMQWLQRNSEALADTIREGSLESFFGGSYRALRDDTERTAFAIPRLEELTQRWIAGVSLAELESIAGEDDERCKTAREFVLRVVPEIAYAAGLIALVWRAHFADEYIMPVSLEVLSSCIKNGLGSPELLAVKLNLRGLHSRRGLIAVKSAISPYLRDGEDIETFGEVQERVVDAIEMARILGDLESA